MLVAVSLLRNLAALAALCRLVPEAQALPATKVPFVSSASISGGTPATERSAGPRSLAALEAVRRSRAKQSTNPLEPLLDVDFVLDANNYLEDFINASDIPKQLYKEYYNDYVAPLNTTALVTATTEAARPPSWLASRSSGAPAPLTPLLRTRVQPPQSQ
mmetsp:Transcript_76772/g.155943  ORF Transcript_76772/g.155943 Transcript_76772/m.155943 type:complete len:160 (+) Transcript_76772:73-552(+)